MKRQEVLQAVAYNPGRTAQFLADALDSTCLEVLPILNEALAEGRVVRIVDREGPAVARRGFGR